MRERKNLRPEWDSNLTSYNDQVNTHGYEVHFDLQNHVGQMDRLGWDNPEVTWEEVDCPPDLAVRRPECECQQSVVG
nr:hypothetical protein BaRGS_023791 [Batillaria attramentaria]